MVARRRRHDQRTRRDAAEELALVERKRREPRRQAVEFVGRQARHVGLHVLRQPVREPERIHEVGKVLQRLRSAAVRDHEREAHVMDAGDRRVLAHAALADDRDLRLVDLRQGLEKIPDAHRPPRPRRMHQLLVRQLRWIEYAPYGLGSRVTHHVVGAELVEAERGERETALEKLFHADAVGTRPAGRRLVLVGKALEFEHRGIVGKRMVPAEVGIDEDGQMSRAAPLLRRVQFARQIDKHRELVRSVRVLAAYDILPPPRRAVERISEFDEVEVQLRRFRRHCAVDAFVEELQDCRAHLRRPFLRRLYARSVRKRKHVLRRIALKVRFKRRIRDGFAGLCLRCSTGKGDGRHERNK